MVPDENVNVNAMRKFTYTERKSNNLTLIDNAFKQKHFFINEKQFYLHSFTRINDSKTDFVYFTNITNMPYLTN